MISSLSCSPFANGVLRALQIVFALIILGTNGYAVHVFQGHTVDDHFSFGNFVDYVGVPDSWGFLLFCAAWAILGVVAIMLATIFLSHRRFTGYICLAVEAIALLSWLAGFIAVAVNLGSSTCPAEEHGCGAVIAATVFAALEFVLFSGSTTMTYKLVFYPPRYEGQGVAEPKSLAPRADIV
ncbi:hypothetical protein SEUCBS140593_007518 [Sporothrix eucalyptigena]|uniref:MARVEL domain-containing protein n=1 Tax=Sporothrix eucalyptigena TaxID=1812306 RepID=A0ABP0CGM5_9PEZI